MGDAEGRAPQIPDAPPPPAPRPHAALSSPLPPFKRKLIVDTDSGGDDAVALMTALSDPSIEIVAITTCWGNVGVDQAVENVGKLLDFYGIDIPIYRGAEGPLVGDKETTAWEGYGKDGYGDANFPKAVHQAVSDEPACIALLNLLRQVRPMQDSGELWQVAVLGPCTNLALALKLDKSICNNLGGEGYPGVLLMGGAYEAKGNSNMAAEFNIHCDPEAAHIVLASIPRPVMLIAWELTVSCPLTWEWFDRWLGREKDRCQRNRAQIFLEQLFQKLESFTRPLPSGEAADTGDDPSTQDETCVIPDAVAMVALLDHRFVVETFETHCTVELWGRETRGMTVIDWYGTDASMRKANRLKNCTLVTKVNVDVFLRRMESIINCGLVSEHLGSNPTPESLFAPGKRRSLFCRQQEGTDDAHLHTGLRSHSDGFM